MYRALSNRRLGLGQVNCGQNLASTLKRSTILAVPALFLLLAPAAAQTTIAVDGGGTVTTTDNDIYVNHVGPCGVPYCPGGGGITLKPNSTTTGDVITIQSVTANVQVAYAVPSGTESRAIDIGPTDVGSGTYATTGPYTVNMHGSVLSALPNSGAAAFNASTAAGTITLDTTGGAANTINGAIGYNIWARSPQDGGAVLKLGPDQITTNSGSWVSAGIQVVSSGNGTVSIDTAGTTISSPGQSVAGILVQGSSGDVTLGGSNGGLSGTISVPNSFGIGTFAYSPTETTRITLSSAETITARGGFSFYAHNFIVDNFGTIIANGDLITRGSADNETITLESGSKTVGQVAASLFSGSINTFNIYTGADISGTTFTGNTSATNSIHLKGTGTATFDIGSTTSIASIQKDDAGTWILTNSGSASGIAFTVNSGTLQISSDANLGTGGTLALMNGTTLGFTASGTFTHAVTVQGDPTFNIGTGNTVTYSGLIADGASPGTVEVSGGGTLALTNTANSYSGGTAVDSSSTLVVMDGGELGHGNVTLNGGSLRFTPAFGQIARFAGNIGGTGSLTVAGTGGVVVLSGTNSYTGGTFVQQGSQLAVAGSITGDVVLSAGTEVSFGRSDNVTFAGNISGGGDVSQEGNGTLTLTGNNTYSGGTAAELGRLAFSSNANVGTGDIFFDFGTIQYNASFTSTSNYRLDRGAIDTNGNSVVISGVLQSASWSDTAHGNGGLKKIGVGTLILTNTETYANGTVISAGTLQIGDGGATGYIPGDVANSGTLAFDRSDALNFSGIISGTGSVSQIGGGTTTLTAVSSYTGATTITAGTLALSGSGSIASSSGVADNATFDISGTTSGATITTLSGNGTVVLGGKTLTISNGSTEFSGAIGGTGGLAVIGGAETLSGTNAYTGGTTIASGATLQLGNGATSGSIAGNVTDNGVLVFDRSDTYTFAGDISGTGAISLIGSGRVIFTGHNGLTGGVGIGAGNVVHMADLGGYNGPITNNGTIDFNISGNTTFAGTISGSGGLSYSGGGTLTLTGNNSYTGNTYVNTGAVSIASDANLGIGGTVVLAPGTSTILTSGGTFTHPVTVAGDPTFSVASGTTATWSGLISDGSTPGDVEITGGGTLILNAVNTYTGGTTVTSGRLVIGDSSHATAVIDSHSGGVTVAARASLSGFGKITGAVTNNGTIATGLTAGSLTVGGLTQNAGGILSVELSPSAASSLTVTGPATLGGTLSANFLSGASTPHVYTVLTAGRISGSFATVTMTGTTSDGVYGLYYAPGGREVDIVATPKAAGQIYGDLRVAALDTASALDNIVMDRLNGERSDNGSAWSLWVRGLGGSAHTDGDSSVSAFTSTLAGAIGGADYRFENGLSAHATLAYEHSDLKLSGHAVKASTDSLYVSLAGHLPVDRFMLGASGFYLQNSTALARDTEYAGTASAKPDSAVFGFALQAGMPLLDGDLVPAVRLRYSNFHQSAVNETSGGALTLAVPSVDGSELRGDIGAVYSHRFQAGDVELLPKFKLFLDQNLSAAPDSLAMRLAGPGVDFVAPAAKADRTAALIGAGLEGAFGNGWSIDLDLDSRVGPRQTELAGTAGLSWRF